MDHYEMMQEALLVALDDGLMFSWLPGSESCIPRLYSMLHFED